MQKFCLYVRKDSVIRLQHQAHLAPSREGAGSNPWAKKNYGAQVAAHETSKTFCNKNRGEAVESTGLDSAGDGPDYDQSDNRSCE